MNRRTFLRSLALPPLAAASAPLIPASSRTPNIIVILADDLGYGDLGCYGSSIATPNLDRMAEQGVRFTNFLSASPVCSPARAALMTGRYGVRGGVPYALASDGRGGLDPAELTLAQSLKAAGYRTSCVGKWHLGTSARHLPTARGFDDFFGVPYSNDQDPGIVMRNADVIEVQFEQETLTRRFTNEAIRAIRRANDRPFFLYLAHTAPHVPLAASPDFRGSSPLGIYGDVVSELDWSVGQIYRELAARNLADDTFVIFTSDNGPWFQGSPGRLRGRKGDTFEGGMRAPFLATWPGRIAAGKRVSGFASMLDVFPTVTQLVPAAQSGTGLDGVSIWPMLAGESADVDRPPFLYLDGCNIQCIRSGRWKLHLARYNGPAFTPEPAVGRINLPLLRPELYDLDADPEEGYDVAASQPDIVQDLRARLDAMMPTLPIDVRHAWRATLERRATPVNSGQWPSVAP